MPEAYSIPGTVKSWNGMKGYGFITSEGIAGDILFSRNELPQDAREVQGSFLQGRAVALEAQEGPDGRAKATSVQILAVEGQPVAGSIKSYSEKNGYGFVTSSSVSEDVRFQRTDLPPLVAGVNLTGTLVTFHVQARPDGKLMVKQLKFQSASQKGSGKGATFGIIALPQMTGGKGISFGMAGMPQMAIQQLAMPQMAMTQMSAGTMTGTVKSFSEKNGYGFINIPGQMVDIKFGKSDLQQGSVQAGSQVRFMAMLGADGRMQAKQVQPAQGMVQSMVQLVQQGMAQHGMVQTMAMKRPVAGGCGGAMAAKKPRMAATGAAEVATGQFASGMVKSYNAAKGFGFISSSESPGDIFFMRTNLPPEAQGGSIEGQMVSYELVYAPDGKLRARNLALGA